MSKQFLPEGMLIDSSDNRISIRNMSSLQEAMCQGKILEARAVICDSRHNLVIDFGGFKGLIPREEGALGIEDGTTRDIAIISRVNKPVCFKVTGFERCSDGRTMPLLSRRAAQVSCLKGYLAKLVPGDIISARITHLEPFGCFVDIGCGIPSLIPIDAISVSRISHPSDRFVPGQEIRAVVRSIDPRGRICLTHKELLGTWCENASMFVGGETVAGIVRSVESYGVFVELAPNLAGLAEPRDNVVPGQQASVYIKSIIPEKMKVKLVIVDAFNACYHPTPLRYFIEEGHIDRWRYSPDCADKLIESVFC